MTNGAQVDLVQKELNKRIVELEAALASERASKADTFIFGSSKSSMSRQSIESLSSSKVTFAEVRATATCKSLRSLRICIYIE